MKNIDQILDAHKKWLANEEGGKRAVFRNTFLKEGSEYGHYLSHVDLHGADCSGVSLINSGFMRSDLRKVDFSYTDLRGCNFMYANLEGANFYKAMVCDTDFRECNLKSANFKGADLRQSIYRIGSIEYQYGANFFKADLTGAKIDFQIEKDLLTRIAKNALVSEETLIMKFPHENDIIGWALKLSPKGKELENIFGAQVAALLLLGPEAHGHFYDDNEQARAYLQSVLK